MARSLATASGERVTGGVVPWNDEGGEREEEGRAEQAVLGLEGGDAGVGGHGGKVAQGEGSRCHYDDGDGSSLALP